MPSHEMPADPQAALADGRLWSEFCEGLKLAGAQVLAADTPADGLTRAEGYRYLTRLLRLGLEKYVEFGDPDFPQFYSLSHETAKIGNDNPDNFYLNCAVDGRRDYRITGNRGSVAYLSIETKAGSFAGGGDMAPTGQPFWHGASTHCWHDIGMYKPSISHFITLMRLRVGLDIPSCFTAHTSSHKRQPVHFS